MDVGEIEFVVRRLPQSGFFLEAWAGHKAFIPVDLVHELIGTEAGSAYVALQDGPFGDARRALLRHGLACDAEDGRVYTTDEQKVVLERIIAKYDADLRRS